MTGPSIAPSIAPLSSQSVYAFGGGVADGRAKDKMLLGGKGANLAEMTALGLPVPPGFTITTDVCRYWVANAGYPADLTGIVEAALANIGTLTNTTFGSGPLPLLVSVRSGAPASMPGMMDTILNLGLNDVTVVALAEQTGNPRFAWDCYRRFIAMYGEVVLGIAGGEHESTPFEKLLEDKKAERRIFKDSDLDATALQELVAGFLAVVLQVTGQPFPQNVFAQLWGAIGAVFRSWDNPRADYYRRMHGLPASMGTAVNVQAMVFGNLGEDSATGVCFTRNPSTGERVLYGEFLINAQGEDVVAGIRTPEPIADLQARMPEAFTALCAVATKLEDHFTDIQDIEFTIQHKQLFMLQTRNGKRAGKAMIKIAVDMVHEGRITPRDAVLRMDAAKLDEVLHPTIDPAARPPRLAKGLPASPGAAIGKVAFSAEQAQDYAKRGESAILVRTETSPEDIHGMQAATGILTSRGGMTSHAAVVARGMGKPCVTACTALKVDSARGKAVVMDASSGVAVEVAFKKGDLITIDGSTGEVFVGAAPLRPAEFGEELKTLMGWVDGFRQLKVRTNADTAVDARTARSFGAEGIGLCRTEHMFFAPDRILAVRRMILADDEAGRRAALATILPMQQGDFEQLFRVMHGLPVTIRLLDPPLHEFLPHTEKEIAAVAAELGASVQAMSAKVQELTEANPMLGHRGVRLAITYPEIYQIQAEAIARAAAAVHKAGIDVQPEIMIPLVMVPLELAKMRALVAATVDAVFADAKVTLPYTIGTMIELPRACVVAGKIAEHADFFSFGTNDLTQTTYGLSRDDAGRFLPSYIDGDVLANDPFVVLDREGVGELMLLAVRGGRAVKPNLKIGICGEHGGEPSSVEFCHTAGFDYVSCSPFRVPIARVAAARAALLAPRPAADAADKVASKASAS
ncbi:MAG: pyruvate, phosphate dikinase [Kofleriaceae bacterium]|nr:pyruvate, phosphate dikinase [Kofleriaceae bacterium]